MKNKDVHLNRLDSYFKASPENMKILVQRSSANGEVDGGLVFAAGLIDSFELVRKFDLSKKCVIPLEISIYDAFSARLHQGFDPRLRVEIEGAPLTVFHILPGSPFEHLFNPEYSLSRLSRKRVRQSSYVQLLRKLQKRNVRLYFDGVMEYTPEPHEHLGCGLIVIRCFIPRFNYLIEVLKKEKIL